MSAANCKKKVALEMIIKSAVCFVEKDEELRVKWERGTKSIQTKKKSIEKNISDIAFNERFKMNASFDYNQEDDCWLTSPTVLTLYCSNKQVGSVTIDLANYIGKKSKTEKAVIGPI